MTRARDDEAVALVRDILRGMQDGETRRIALPEGACARRTVQLRVAYVTQTLGGLRHYRCRTEADAVAVTCLRAATAPWNGAEALRLQEEGWSETRLAAHYGLPRHKLRGRLAEAGLPGARRVATQPPRCLGCGKPFASEGAHHRVCDGCKATDVWRSGPTHALAGV